MITEKSITASVPTNSKGPSMLRLARSARLLVAVALVMGLRGSSAADDFQNYPAPRPLPGWSNQPAGVSPDARSNWPGAPAARPSNPPRLLPTRYAAAETPAGATGGSSPTGPAAETIAGSRPIPLSPRSSEGPSPLGGLSGGNIAGLVDAATSLGIVLGLFLLVVWAVRRGMPKGSGLLPSEAVEVLGRASLAGRQQVHLVRCGNKIVLLSVAASGTQTLTEISDPAEVDRLHSICQPNPPGGLWRRFFGHFTDRSRPADYYARDEGHPIDFHHLETSGQRRA
jgi:flagellar protein FliO/FliZ